MPAWPEKEAERNNEPWDSTRWEKHKVVNWYKKFTFPLSFFKPTTDLVWNALKAQSTISVCDQLPWWNNVFFVNLDDAMIAVFVLEFFCVGVSSKGGSRTSFFKFFLNPISSLWNPHIFHNSDKLFPATVLVKLVLISCRSRCPTLCAKTFRGAVFIHGQACRPVQIQWHRNDNVFCG